MPKYTVEEISHIVSGKLYGPKDAVVDNLFFDSRNYVENKNSLFVAIIGERHNGHDFITKMYDEGVRSFLVNNLRANYTNLPGAAFIVVKHTLKALQHIATYHRSQYTFPVVAITGSNGKTIVKEWLAISLSTRYRVIRSPKSFNSQLGVPLSVWMMSESDNYAVFEAGISLPDEMAQLEKIIRPTEGIITNIGEAHQQGFSSIERKLKEKLQLFDNCDRIFYCRDHELIHEEISKDQKYNKKELVCWSKIDSACRLFVSSLSQNNSKSSLTLLCDGKEMNVIIPFIDKASIENCLQVINYLLYHGFSEAELNECLQQMHPVAMRMEQIEGVNNCTIINDSYNSDINALNIAVDYLNQLSSGKSVLILSDILQSGEHSEQLYRRVAHIIDQAGVDFFIGIGEAINTMQSCFSNLQAMFYTSVEEYLSDFDISRLSNATVLVKGARGFHFERIVQALSKNNHTTVLESNLNSLVHNLNCFRSLLKTDTGIMVMVKALAYGSGSNEIANILQHEKVNYLGVAFSDEGVELRSKGVSLPIMVMAPAVEDFERLIDNKLEPELYSLRILKKFIEIAERQQMVDYPIHLKIDTGMHRLGFLSTEIKDVIELLKSTSAVRVKSVFSHLAASDEKQHDAFTHEQIALFKAVSEKLKKALGYTHIRHILNSAGIERFPEAHFEMVRLGIGLHGISSIKQPLQPVSTLKTHIAQIKKLSAAETVGYGRRGKILRNSMIAIIPVGYADGLDRKLGNGNAYVSISGEKAPYVGSICMDLCMVDITGINCVEGDEVVIFGDDPDIQQLAKAINTIPYEVLTNVSARVKRIYLKD